MSIKLAVRTDGGWHRFTAEFATETQAIAYAAARRSTHIVAELDDRPIGAIHTKLLGYLYPSCEHGMDAGLCLGPAHYATDAEIAMGY